MSKLTLVEGAAPDTPSTNKVAVYAKADGKAYIKDDTGTETDLTAGAAGGDTHPITDITAIVKGTTDTTKTFKLDVGNQTAGVTGELASTFTTAKTLILPDAADTLIGKATTDTLTNKTIDGTDNTLIVGSSNTLGAAPSRIELKGLIGPPDGLYVSLRTTGSTWSWIPIVDAP